MNQHENGMRRMREILGPNADTVIENLSKISPDFAHYVVDFSYGDIYSRPGLSDKMREAMAVACLMGQGNTKLPLKSHIKGMLNVGWQKEEIIEIIIFLTIYCGFPTAVDTMAIAQEVFEAK